MFLVGLTGGIAAGKSTVSELWQELGAEVIDADELAREIVHPGSPGLIKIVELFGPITLNEDGSLNRQALASLVFGSVDKRKPLEGITHPLISELAQEKISQSKSSIVVYAIPLLVESKSSLPFDYIVTVEAPIRDQIDRMVTSRGMTRLEAEARIAAQASPAQRANVSDRILSSNQSLKLFLKDARLLWSEIEKLAATKEKEGKGHDD